MKSGVISINMAQFRQKYRITDETVRRAEVIYETNGSFFTLDAMPYMDDCLEFGVFFTFAPSN